MSRWRDGGGVIPGMLAGKPSTHGAGGQRPEASHGCSWGRVLSCLLPRTRLVPVTSTFRIFSALGPDVGQPWPPLFVE